MEDLRYLRLPLQTHGRVSYASRNKRWGPACPTLEIPPGPSLLVWQSCGIQHQPHLSGFPRTQADQPARPQIILTHLGHQRFGWSVLSWEISWCLLKEDFICMRLLRCGLAVRLKRISQNDQSLRFRTLTSQSPVWMVLLVPLALSTVGVEFTTHVPGCCLGIVSFLYHSP